MGWLVARRRSQTAWAIEQFRSSPSLSAVIVGVNALRLGADQLKTKVTYPVEQAVKVRLVADFTCEGAVGRSGF
jgi:hypothetical protein